jgi:hypothetical protein
MKFTGDLGAWIVPKSIDEKVIRRELDRVDQYKSYVVDGGLLSDLTEVSRRGRAPRSGRRPLIRRRWK